MLGEASTLFSPSQTSGSETTVRSIFSPAHGGVTSARYRSSTSTGTRHDKRSAVSGYRSRFSNRAGTKSTGRWSTLGKEVIPEVDEDEKKETDNYDVMNAPAATDPYRWNDHGTDTASVDHTENDLMLSQDSEPMTTPVAQRRKGQSDSVDLDEFMTPQTAYFKTPRASVMGSAVSHSSNTTFHSVSIDMLSFEYVSTCKSTENLEMIVQALSSEYPQRYPSLLRTAKKQLETVKTDTPTERTDGPDCNRSRNSDRQEFKPDRSGEFMAIPIEACATDQSFVSPLKGDKPNASYISWSPKDDESSLVMSFSTSEFPYDADPSVADSTPSTLNSRRESRSTGRDGKKVERISSSVIRTTVSPLPGKRNTSTKGMTTEKRPIALDFAESAGAGPSEDTASLRKEMETIIRERNEAERILSARVQELRELVRNTEGSDDVLRLIQLERLCEAETLARADPPSGAATSTTTRRTGSTPSPVKALRAACEALKSKVDCETAEREDMIRRAEEADRAMKHKIAVLGEKLARSEASIATTKQRTEEKVRAENRKQIESLQQTKEELRRSVDKTQSFVTAIRKEQHGMLEALQVALGREPTVVQEFNDRQRKGLVSDVVRKLASSKAAVKALATALSGSEQDRMAIEEDRRRARAEINDLRALNAKVEKENSILQKKNQDIAFELERTNEYLESIQKGGEEKWRVKEEDYRATIAGLRKQIISSEAMVPLALYRKATEDSRDQSKLLREKHKIISDLRAQVGKLSTTRALPPKVSVSAPARVARPPPTVTAPPKHTRAPTTTVPTKQPSAIKQRTRASRTPSPSKALMTIKSRLVSTVPSKPLRGKAPRPFGNITNTNTPSPKRRQESGESYCKAVTPKSAPNRSATQRLAAVRAAGGRAGLTAKLQYMRNASPLRSPSPTSTLRPIA